MTVDLCAACMGLARAASLRLPAIVRRSLVRVTSLLPRMTTSVVVAIDVGRAPASGVSGWTDQTTGRVHISLHSHVDAVGDELRTWLPFTLAHELDHAARIRRGPGIGRTLLGWLLAEGMADAFAIQAFPSSPPTLGDHALTPEQTTASWSRLRPRLRERQGPKDFHAWFYGGNGIPPFTGYTIGYDLVTGYLAAHPGLAPADLVSLPADEILAGSGFTGSTP